MTIKIYSTDTECPHCGTDIYQAVYQRLSENGGVYLDFCCPACDKMVFVEVESVPSFKLSRLDPQP